MVCKIHIDFVSNIFKGWANFLEKFVDWTKFSLTFIIDFVVELIFLGFLLFIYLFIYFRSIIFLWAFFIFYEPFLWFKVASLILLSQIAKN